MLKTFKDFEGASERLNGFWVGKEGTQVVQMESEEFFSALARSSFGKPVPILSVQNLFFSSGNDQTHTL